MVKKHLIHAVAICKKCEWRCEDYRAAQRQAAKHCKAHGHRVLIDLGYYAEYLPPRIRNKGAR